MIPYTVSIKDEYTFIVVKEIRCRCMSCGDCWIQIQAKDDDDNWHVVFQGDVYYDSDAQLRAIALLAKRVAELENK